MKNSTLKKMSVVRDRLLMRPRKHPFLRSAVLLVLTVLLTVGLVPFSVTPSYAWAPDVEPVLSDGKYYIRPYLYAADGSWYEGSYSIGINDHGAAWHNDAITYSENNPIKIEKTSKKNSDGRTTYTLYDDGGWFGAFRRFTNQYNGSGSPDGRLVGCSPEWDTAYPEYFAFEYITQVAGASDKYIVNIWEGAVGSAPYKVALEEGNTNSKNCHLRTVSSGTTFMWVLTKK